MDTRLLFCEDAYVKIPIEIPVEVRSYVGSPLVKEESNPLISRNNSKEPSNLYKYVYVGQGIYNLSQSMLRAVVYVG